MMLVTMFTLASDEFLMALEGVIACGFDLPSIFVPTKNYSTYSKPITSKAI